MTEPTIGKSEMFNISASMPRKLGIGEALKKGAGYVRGGVKEYFFWSGTAHDYLERERGWKCAYAHRLAWLGGVGHTIREDVIYSELYDYVPENLRRVVELGIISMGLLRITPTMIARAEHKQEQKGMSMGIYRLRLEDGGT